VVGPVDVDGLAVGLDGLGRLAGLEGGVALGLPLLHSGERGKKSQEIPSNAKKLQNDEASCSEK